MTTVLTVLFVLPPLYLRFAPPPGLDEVALASQESFEAPAGLDDRQPVGAPAFGWPVPPITIHGGLIMQQTHGPGRWRA